MPAYSLPANARPEVDPASARAAALRGQLEFPNFPPRVEREPPLPRHKRCRPPVHLMVDIEATGGYRPVGENTSLAVPLYAHDACGFRPATNREIFLNAHEALKQRFRADLPVTTYPELLRSFLQAKIGAQRCCVFLALFVTRDEMLIQVAELFRGTTSYVDIYPREVARAAMECEAEGVICVRTDARGSPRPLRTTFRQRSGCANCSTCWKRR